jgi:hypothetical protein
VTEPGVLVQRRGVLVCEPANRTLEDQGLLER